MILSLDRNKKEEKEEMEGKDEKMEERKGGKRKEG